MLMKNTLKLISNQSRLRFRSKLEQFSRPPRLSRPELNPKLSVFAALMIGLFFTAMATAQSVEDVRWKTEEQVRSVLGEPLKTSNPVGTHASYTLWEYQEFTVAFANNRAFHLFDKNSLRKIELDENRASESGQ